MKNKKIFVACDSSNFNRINKIINQLDTCSLPDIYGRVPDTPPLTPLAAGERT